jgi:TPP-dependent pyruvate/acetoin dehydrogenase alpha subunit
MPAVRVDGADFFAVQEAMTVATRRARAGQGPSFIEARCVRHHGHYCGDPQTYRSKAELAAAQQDGDPLKRFRERVLAAGLLEVDEFEGLDAEIVAELDQAVAAAHAGAPPALSALHRDVYLTY